MSLLEGRCEIESYFADFMLEIAGVLLKYVGVI